MPEYLQQFIRDWGPRLLGVIVVLVAGRWLIGLAVRGLTRILERQQLGPGALGFLRTLLRLVLWVALAITVLAMLGVPTTSFVAVLGAMGLAVGLALQSTLSNFAAGIMLLVQRPIEVGEEIQTGVLVGTVTEIQLMTTSLLTEDGKVVIVPNGQLTAGAITNFSRSGRRLATVTREVPYYADIERAKRILLDIVGADTHTLPTPAPATFVSTVAAGSVEVSAQAWVLATDYETAERAWREAAKVAFDAAGLAMTPPPEGT